MSDFSIISLFARADLVVKLVMLLLFSASLWSWAIIFSKFIKLQNIKQRTKGFINAFQSSATTLDALFTRLVRQNTCTITAVFIAAMREYKHGEKLQEVSQRLELAMQNVISKETISLRCNLSSLASIGSISPFIGLFGTVWGIMNSFRDIALAQSTNLVIVAPGIAEALFATALGLLAAIPSVLAYNIFHSDISEYLDKLDIFAGDLLNILLQGNKLDAKK